MATATLTDAPAPPALPALLLAAPLAAMLAALTGTPASARVLQAGPGQEYELPSAAAAAAQDGDTVNIAPGEYFDCAIWHASHLTIAAEGAGATLTDKACVGKAAFVIEGDGVTLRNLGFARIRVPDGNGAGIRAEGRDLTVISSRFDNDQVGILAGGGGALRIEDCSFTANGVSPDGKPTHAVLAGAIDLLAVSNSRFNHARGGDHIASAARRTELRTSQLADEGGRMTGALVHVWGTEAVLDGNTFTLAAGAAARPGVVLATGDAAQITLRGNTLAAPDGSVPLLRNWAGADVTASANTVPPGGEAVSDSGATYRRLRARAAALREAAGDAARVLRHLAAQAARGLGVIR